MLFFDFVLADNLSKALIKIQENEIVPWFVQKLQCFILRLFEESRDLLQLILECDVLKFWAIAVWVQVKKESQLVRTGRAVDVSVYFFEYFLLEFLLLWYLLGGGVLGFFGLLF